MPIKQRPIVAYHCVIPVEKAGQVLELHIDRPDWSPDDEILKEVAQERDCQTVGEIAESLAQEGAVKACGHVDSYYSQGNKDIREWDAQVG